MSEVVLITMGTLAYRLAEMGDLDGLTGVVGRMTTGERADFTLAVQHLADAIEATSPDDGEEVPF